ncbi:MAG: RNA polymerase sigma factor [Polyangiales bacterium]
MGQAVTDLELLERWGDGDRDAGGELFERYFDPLLRFFQNKVDHGVEDLVQQTLLACVEGRARFRGDASFRTYLFQTARFHLYAHYRKRSRQGEVDFALTSVADLGTSPSGVVARKQEQRWLLEALRRIPLEYQLVLELSIWEDLSGKEMAEILGIPEPTLRSRLRIAIERLRKQMLELSGDDHGITEVSGDFQEWARKVREVIGWDAVTED